MAGFLESFKHNERVASITAHILVLMMVTCQAIVTISFSEWLVPNWRSSGLVIVCVLISMETIYSYRLVKKLFESDSYKLGYHIAEALILIILIKIYSELQIGNNLFENILNWSKNFWGSFFTTQFVVNFVIILLVWISIRMFSTNLYKLEEIEDILKGLNSRYDRKLVHSELIQQYIYVGLFLIFLTGITRQTIISLPTPNNAPSVITPALFLYFIIGLVLLSISHLSNLSGKWGYEETGIQNTLASKWVLYSIAFIGGISLLAFLLPTNYSLRLFEAIRTIVGWLYAGIQFLFALIMVILSAPFALIKPSQPDSPTTQIEPPKPEEFFPEANVTTLPPMEALKSILFWAIFIGIMFFAIRQYLQTNQALANKLKGLKILQWLGLFLKWLTQQAEDARHTISNVIKSGTQKIRAVLSARKPMAEWNFINLRKLDPRRKIYYYFQALVKKSENAGIPRPSSATPNEFSENLQIQISDGQENLKNITDAFMEARYSNHPVTEEMAGKTRFNWEEIRRILGKRGSHPENKKRSVSGSE